ncbi:hypothetical protein D3C78_638310 [compost metagenome]
MVIIYVQPAGGGPGVVTTILLVVIGAAGQLPQQGLPAIAAHRKQTCVVAIRGIEGLAIAARIGLHLLLLPVGATGQVEPLDAAPAVDPGEAGQAGVDRLGAGLPLALQPALQLVLAVAGFQPAGQGLALELETTVVLEGLHPALVGRLIGVVHLGLVVITLGVEIGTPGVVEGMVHPDLAIEAVEAVPIRLLGTGHHVEPIGPLIAHQQVHVGLLAQSLHGAQLALTITMAACAPLQVGLAAILGGGLGDEVDDATYGIRTVDGGARPADVLDALYVAEGDLAEIGRASHHGGDGAAIHQHQGVVGVGAADEEAAHMAPATQGGDLYPGQGLEQIRQARYLAGFNLGAIDHHHGSQHSTDGLFHPVGGDHHGVIGRKGRLGKGRRWQQGSRQ